MAVSGYITVQSNDSNGKLVSTKYNYINPDLLDFTSAEKIGKLAQAGQKLINTLSDNTYVDTIVTIERKASEVI